MPIFVAQLEQQTREEKLIYQDIRPKAEESYNSEIQQLQFQLQQTPKIVFYDIYGPKPIRPNDIIVKVLYFVCLFLDPKFSSQDDPFIASLNFQKQTEQKFYSISPAEITEYQFNKLRQIQELNPEYVKRSSLGGFYIYQYLRLMVELRGTQFYIYGSSLNKLATNIEKMEKQIKIFNQIQKNDLIQNRL